MGCPNCDQLRAEDDRRELHHANAVTVFASGVESVSASEFILLRATVAETRIDSEIARLELERHKQIHSKAN